MSTKAVFVEGNLMRHVVVMSFTSSVGLMAIFAVDFIDMMFIAMLGNDALAAAVGYAGTLLFFTNAINIGISIAAGTLVARYLGADDEEEAQSCATNVALVGMVSGVLIPLLIWPFLGDILALFGAQGAALTLALSYIKIILPSMIFMSLAMIGMAVLRSYGDARRPMLATLLGGFVNAVLDPLFIFGFDWQLEGAAWASVIARITMFFMVLWPLLKVYNAFSVPKIVLIKRDALTVFSIAIPAVLANIATPVGMAVVTREVAKFGTEAVAGMAVIGRLTPMVFAVLLALSGAIGPIIGQNYGAGRLDRVKGGFNNALQFSALYVLAAALILYLLREPISLMFNAQGLTQDLLYLFCGPLALASFFNAVIFVTNAGFNNLGHPIYSSWVNWGRHTLGTWPLAILGAAWYGAEGVLIGQAIGGVIFAGIAYWLMHRLIDTIEHPVEHEPFAQHLRHHLLFGRGRW